MLKVHNEELAKQWSLRLLSMYYLLQTTHDHFNWWFTYMRKLYFKSYVLNTRNTINGVFLVTFDIVMLNTVKIMLAVLVRHFYDICKYMASLGTAK